MNFTRRFNSIASARGFCSINKVKNGDGDGIPFWPIFGGIMFPPTAVFCFEFYSNYINKKERRERELYRFYFDKFYDLKKSEESKKVPIIPAPPPKIEEKKGCKC